ncbi:MAG TPA: glycoside hydrolase family 9 protein [Chthonomonadales bacterium]|nr:glycoside hydrolase family 9 protein [Chthonomonadales bacterium]
MRAWHCMARREFVALAALSLSRVTRGSGVVAVQPLTDRIAMVHFDDGYVTPHRRGEPRSAETVTVNPLDVTAAMRAESYTISSTDDTAYRTGRRPVRVFRKSKGTEFAWFVDQWIDGRAVNTRPDHAAEHWLYLELPEPLRQGRSYSIGTGGLARNGSTWRLRFVTARARSEAVHVNTLGYVPAAPQKFAYVYHWMGDGGPLDVRALAGRRFHVVDRANGRRVFSGMVRFRMGRDAQETSHISDSPPHGSFLGADVAECDFSAFRRPGAYVVEVEGVGCSWPFRLDDDVYRPVFRAVARALYHNRSGIALTRPHTEFERPAPHNPRLTPEFAGKLRYTRVRVQEWGSEGGDAQRLMAESPGTLEDAWGWYQDAGDWDSYPTHFRVPQELLLVYEMGPRKFTDGELNIPESGNGVPDILDEAAWLPRFCERLRAELKRKGWGTGGVGLRVAGDAFGTDEGTRPDGTKFGRGSWEDTDRVYMVSGEDPLSTFRYAGVAAHLAYCLRLAGVRRDPGGIGWAREAQESWAWALANTGPGDDDSPGSELANARSYAAASLFRLTGDVAYEERLTRDVAHVTPTSLLWEHACYGPAVYVLGGGPGRRDGALVERLRAALLNTADESLLRTPARRALRWGGNWWFPMLVGQQTTPLVLEGVVGYTLVRRTDPERARRYLGALYTTCDYFLGTNSLNQTWVTGIGPRFPTQIFHMDAWYNGKGRFHPGLIPYSPWRRERQEGVGPWDHDWPNKTLHPSIDAWPGNERWFSNRCSPLGSEFTVHQNLGPAAAIYGFLCAERRVVSTPGRARPARPTEGRSRR